VPLSGQEVEQTLGCDVVSEIANKVGVSQRFARTVLGYAIPRTIGLLATGGAIPSAIPVTASSFLDSAIPLSSPHVEAITQHGAEQIPPSRTEHGGSASKLGWLLIPGAALLINSIERGRRSCGHPVRADCGAKCAGSDPAFAFDNQRAWHSAIRMVSLFTPALSETTLLARQSPTRSKPCSEPTKSPAISPLTCMLARLAGPRISRQRSIISRPPGRRRYLKEMKLVSEERSLRRIATGS